MLPFFGAIGIFELFALLLGRLRAQGFFFWGGLGFRVFFVDRA